MPKRIITDEVIAAIKEAIETHPTYVADRIVGLVFEATPASVRDIAKEMGHSWPERRKAHMPPAAVADPALRAERAAAASENMKRRHTDTEFAAPGLAAERQSGAAPSDAAQPSPAQQPAQRLMHNTEIKEPAFTDAAKQAVGSRWGLADWRVKKVEEFVERRLYGPISVGELAQTVGRSATHFAREFKHTVGETPHTYIIRKRLELAQHLMTTTDAASLADIAAACGFTDQNHFNRLFKRTYGKTPGRWRRQMKGAAAEALRVPDRDTSPSSAAASTPDGTRRPGAPNPEHRP